MSRSCLLAAKRRVNRANTDRTTINEDHSPFLIRRVNRAARGLGDALSPGKDLKYSIVSPPRDFAAYFLCILFSTTSRGCDLLATLEFRPRDARGHYKFQLSCVFSLTIKNLFAYYLSFRVFFVV